MRHRELKPAEGGSCCSPSPSPSTPSPRGSRQQEHRRAQGPHWLQTQRQELSSLCDPGMLHGAPATPDAAVGDSPGSTRKDLRTQCCPSEHQGQQGGVSQSLNGIFFQSFCCCNPLSTVVSFIGAWPGLNSDQPDFYLNGSSSFSSSLCALE